MIRASERVFYVLLPNMTMGDSNSITYLLIRKELPQKYYYWKTTKMR